MSYDDLLGPEDGHEPGKVPAFSIASEQYALGDCLRDETGSRFDELRVRLRLEDFGRDLHQKIFEAMETVRDSGGAISHDSVLMEIQARGWEKKFGNKPGDAMRYLGECVYTSGGGLNFDKHVDKIADLAHRQKLKPIAGAILEAIQDPSRSAEEIAVEAETAILQANQRHAQQGPVWASDIADDVFDEIDRLQVLGRSPGYPTGIDAVNDLIGGLTPGDLILIAARPSMGKTTLAMNFGESIMEQKGLPVLFFSLEMKRASLMMRRISSISKVPLPFIQGRYSMSTDQRLRVAEAKQAIKSLPLLIDDTRGRTIGQIAALTRKLQARDQIAAVIIDYVQLITDDKAKKNQERHQEVAAISRRLQTLAGDLNIPVIALSQLNRASAARADKTPMISDLRESGALEQDADLLMMLHWEWFYEKDKNSEGAKKIKNKSLLIVGKQRNGETGHVPVGFYPECCYFCDLPSESEEALKQGKTVPHNGSNGSAF